MKLFIQNMYTKSDIVWLRSVLDELDIKYEKELHLSELSISPMVTPRQLIQLTEKLNAGGFSILHDRKEILVEQVKLVVAEMLQDAQYGRENYSAYISNRMHLNYSYLANIFSELQLMTIERYVIEKKIEKAKQLLALNNYTISQIADILHYSSIGHFSNQFKKITGLNPSAFKKKEKNSPGSSPESKGSE